jgi:hypothetical protein
VRRGSVLSFERLQKERDKPAKDTSKKGKSGKCSVILARQKEGVSFNVVYKFCSSIK